MHEVVITGVGVVCPIGIGRDAFWEAVQACRSGVRETPELSGDGRASPIGAFVEGFEPKQFVRPRKSLKVMCREIQFAFAAADMAWREAGLADANLVPERLGVITGCDMLYSEVDEVETAYRVCIGDEGFEFDRWGECAFRELYPLWMLEYLPNMPACHISISHDTRGPCNTINLGEASSLAAVAEGYRVLRRGIADCIVVGGTGTRLQATRVAWRGGANLSKRIDAPAAACRPFDADRDGIVNGEGAGMLILETLEHAIRRGATPLARIAGVGNAFGQHHSGLGVTGRAVRQSIETAVAAAELTPEKIGHVNAHGLSTQRDDAVEAQAIRACLGDVPVTAPKSLFGNLGAGGGAVELIASVLGIAEGCIPPTRNYQTPDPECPVSVVAQKPRKTDLPTALVINQSRLGQAAAVVVTEF